MLVFTCVLKDSPTAGTAGAEVPVFTEVTNSLKFLCPLLMWNSQQNPSHLLWFFTQLMLQWVL